MMSLLSLFNRLLVVGKVAAAVVPEEMRTAVTLVLG